ncbi:MAG TPA: hypothetical protein PKE20_03575, partial [Promineifilum sp.]|nr:hypothetical protein [Promineifilum sp.]
MNPGSDRPRSGNSRSRRCLILLEGIVLLSATPFLLVPEFSPVATAAALAALGVVWLASLIIVRPPSTPFDTALLLWGMMRTIGILVSAAPAETLPQATGL